MNDVSLGVKTELADLWVDAKISELESGLGMFGL